jgi:signal transduction histidine kinase
VKEVALAAPGSTARPDAAGDVLRLAATRAAQTPGQRLALIFARQAGDEGQAPLRLRAASGYESREQARVASEAVQREVEEALDAGAPRPLAEAGGLGRGASAGLLWPLACEGRSHGVLVVAGSDAPDDGARAQLAEIVEGLSLRLDHAHLCARAGRLEQELARQSQAAEKKGEEVLELSEALFAQDIELLRSHEKLGKVEKLKNDFIEKMSRELRTPLNSIIESIIQVLAGENETLSEAAQASLRRALDEGTSFLRTLQNILDLWRIKQGELPVELHEVNFREVVDEAIFSIQDTLGEKPVQIEKRIVQPFPKIRTDLTKLNQILFLLLDNAAKFTHEGSIHIEASVAEGRLVCEIRDTGIGICADDQQFIFDEFYQVDELSSTKYRGAGLGLTLVRDLVVLLDGELSLASEVGRGSIVTFRLPVQLVG